MTPFTLYELFPDLPPITVLDLGAFDDMKYPAVYAGLVEAGQARILGFEPDLTGCLRLLRKYGARHCFMPLFVGDGNPGRYHSTNRVQTGSLFAPNTPLLEKFNELHEVTTLEAVREVNTVRLDDVLPNEDIDYFKLDIQGGELAAIQGGTKLLEQVVVIHTEVAFVELYENQPLFADVDIYLRSLGFWFHTFRSMGSRGLKPLPVGDPVPEANQRLWCDAVYLRDPFKLERLSTAKLWKMAILLHQIYGSVDFAHHCLNAIDARCGTTAAETYRSRLAAARPGAD
jgi:protein O-GlcNAc transferase